MVEESNLQFLPFDQHLTKEEKKYLAENAIIRDYNKGSIIHSDKTTCLGMISILKGSVRASLLSEEGREVTLFRLEEGDSCVLSASCIISQITFDTQITAEQDCRLLIINAGAFERVTEKNIYVKCFMYELATARFFLCHVDHAADPFAKFDQRLAAFLLREYDKTGNPEISMTHEQIAVQVSSAREVVARMLKRFASDGLVELKRGTILLQDINGLRKTEGKLR